MECVVRPMASTDRGVWGRLYQAYAAFYDSPQSEDMRDRVWGWLMDPDREVFGLMAETSDGAVGLAHVRTFARPLAAETGLFLDDLFVAEAARGSGVVDAIFDAIRAEARQRGIGKIRWITAEDSKKVRPAGALSRPLRLRGSF